MNRQTLASEIAGSNWLQTFASPMGGAEGAPAAAPATAPAAPAQPVVPVVTPGAQQVTPSAQPLVGNLPVQQAPAPQAQPAPAQVTPAPAQAPTLLDFGGRKLPDTTENRALHEDWKNQQAALTRAQQELLQYKRTPAPAPVQPQQAPPTQAPSAQAAPAATQADMANAAADLGYSPEQFSQELYGDNPLRAVAALARTIAQREVQEQLRSIQPAIQRADTFIAQAETDRAIQAAAEKYPDFNRVLPSMVPLFDSNPWLNQIPNGIEVAYQMAKGAMPQQAAAPTVDQMLADPQIRAQVQVQLAQDPNFRTQIQRELIQQVHTAQPQAPVMAGPVAAAVPVMPANTPKNLKEAGEQARAYLAQLRAQQ